VIRVTLRTRNISLVEDDRNDASRSRIELIVLRGCQPRFNAMSPLCHPKRRILLDQLSPYKENKLPNGGKTVFSSVRSASKNC
jgi:hypothetical protein